MKTAGCFHNTLAAITWDRINVFLPNLYQELFIPQVNPSIPETGDTNQVIIAFIKGSLLINLRFNRYQLTLFQSKISIKFLNKTKYTIQKAINIHIQIYLNIQMTQV